MEYAWGTVWGRSVFGMPNAVAVLCPRCRKQASFHPPFTFFRDGTEGTEDCPRWNNSRVQERFPTVFPWADPDNPFRSLFWGTHKRHPRDYPVWGVITCSRCTLLRKHRLAWPTDAFYAVPLQGHVLWAWDRSSLIEVREHVASVIRSKRFHPLLKYLPRHFLLAKHRSALVKAINTKLAEGDA